MHVKFSFMILSFQRGQGAPAREPVLSENEQKAMMAYYYHKQEELKVTNTGLIVAYFQFLSCFLMLRGNTLL